MAKKPKKKPAAKKPPKGGGKKAAATESASTSQAAPMISKARMIGENDFNNLVRRCESLKKQGKEISGTMGELVANAVENKNLDKPAFDIFRKLKRMSGAKLATTLACFDYYRDIGKLDEQANKQGELEIARQEAGEQEDGEPTQRRRRGGKKAAPENGGDESGEPESETSGEPASEDAAPAAASNGDATPPHLRVVEGSQTAH